MGLGAPDRLGLSLTLPEGVAADVNSELPGAEATLSKGAFHLTSLLTVARLCAIIDS